MEMIIRPRRAGKTTELIKKAAEKDAYIVAIDKSECHRIFRTACDQGINIRYPITFDDLLEQRYYAPGVKEIMIDNADIFLNYLTKKLKLSCITMTDKED